MKTPRKTHIGEDTDRRDRLLRERVHDPYRTRLKLEGPAVCPQCGAVYRDDRWTWESLLADEGPAREEPCPACRRINDRYPAGEVAMGGAFLRSHRDEILNLVRNVEEAEAQEHPLHRIMEITERDDDLAITTTDIHLPRRIGQALFDAWRGEFDFDYDEEGYFIRVRWRRDA